MANLLDYAIHLAVERDGLPRVADYDDGSQRVLYLNGEVAQSMPATDWLATRGPLPSDPTPAESVAARAAREAARLAALSAAATKRAQILALAQSAVGVRPELLSTPQLKALLGVLLWQAGALDDTLAVRPLSQWVRE